MNHEKPSYPHYRLPLESFDVKYGIAVRNRMNPHGVGTSIYKREKTSVRRIATQGRHRLNSLVPNKPLRQEFAEWMDKSHKVGAAIVAGGATGEGGLYHAFLRDKGLLAVRGQANGLVYARNITESTKYRIIPNIKKRKLCFITRLAINRKRKMNRTLNVIERGSTPL